MRKGVILFIISSVLILSVFLILFVRNIEGQIEDEEESFEIPIAYGDYSYIPNANGYFEVLNNGEHVSYIGFAVSGNLGGPNLIKTTLDYSWTTLEGFPNYRFTNNDANFNWIGQFNISGNNLKITHTLENNAGEITNAKFWYIQTINQNQQVIWNGTLYTLNETRNIQGDLSDIVTQIHFIGHYSFDYQDLVDSGFEITNFYVGDGGIIGLSGTWLIAVGVTKNNGNFPNGASVILDPSVSGCTETGDLINCSDATFTGNTIDTTKNILIKNAIISGEWTDCSGGTNERSGTVRLNSTLGWINITDSTIDAFGCGINSGTNTGSSGGGNFDIYNTPKGVLINNSVINAYAGDCEDSADPAGNCGVTGVGSCVLRAENITLDDAQINCYGGDSGGQASGLGTTGKIEFRINTTISFEYTNSIINASGGDGNGLSGSAGTCEFYGTNLIAETASFIMSCDGGVGDTSGSGGTSNLKFYNDFVNISATITADGGTCSSCTVGNSNFAIFGNTSTSKYIFRDGSVDSIQSSGTDKTQINVSELTLENFDFTNGNEDSSQLNITSDIGRIGLFGTSSISETLSVDYQGSFGEIIIGNQTSGLTLGSINFSTRDASFFYTNYYGPLTKQTSPSNDSLSSATTTFKFDSLDNTDLKNITLHIWNSSDELITDNTDSTDISGTSNSSTMDFTFTSDGNYTWSALTFNTKDLSDGLLRINYTIQINTLAPNIVIDYVTTTEGSQTITFNGTMSDDTLDACWYTITNSSGEVDSATTENTTFTCNTEQSDTVSAFGTFNLTEYVNDTFGNENSSIKSFTVSSSPGGAGGSAGGGTSVSGLTLAKNFSITTLNLNNKLDIILAKNSTKPRKKNFLLRNNDLDPVRVTVACSTTDLNVTNEVGICNYVFFDVIEFEISPNEQNPIIGEFKVKTPPNAKIGDTFFFNVVAIKQGGQEFSKLSVKTEVTILATFYKWSYMPFQSDKLDEEKRSFPVFGISLLLAIITFVLSLIIFGKIKMFRSGFFVSMGLFMATFVSFMALL